jgi:hypothetical protein
MKILLTESQHKSLIKKIPNDKPSKNFDDLYGTKLSHKYDLSPYTEDEIWGRWMEHSNMGNFDGNLKPFLETLKILPKAFPYIDLTKYDENIKTDVMLGMVSGFNPEDIYYFSILGVKGYMNKEQKELEKKLPPEVAYNIQWVLSPGSIEQIKNKFSIM